MSISTTLPLNNESFVIRILYYVIFQIFHTAEIFSQTITSHKWMCVLSERITITLYYTGFQYTSFSCIQNACTTRISWFHCLIKNTLLFLRYMNFVWNACYLKGLHITFVSQCIRFFSSKTCFYVLRLYEYFRLETSVIPPHCFAFLKLDKGKLFYLNPVWTYLFVVIEMTMKFN